MFNCTKIKYNKPIFSSGLQQQTISLIIYFVKSLQNLEGGYQCEAGVERGFDCKCEVG